MFWLRFPADEIKHWASRYAIEEDEPLEKTIAPRTRDTGYFTRPDFLELCYWKTPASRPLCEQNDTDYIEAVTRTALSTPHERLRIEVLTLLEGVSWPIASVLLHFGHTEPYPILDVRALWSLNVDAEALKYTFTFWNDYTHYCRQLARSCGVAMRELDRALWQYSYENQR
jgi:hypothetical protein